MCYSLTIVTRDRSSAATVVFGVNIYYTNSCEIKRLKAPFQIIDDAFDHNVIRYSIGTPYVRYISYANHIANR